MEKTTYKLMPHLPGVYLFKNAQGTVMYIGKAKSLKNRVATYFHAHQTQWKITELMREYADLDYILTKSETEAMLLEAELIQKYQPKFNQLFKDGQPFVYLVFYFDRKKKLPTLKIVRNKKLKGTYFGPFLHKTQARNVYHFLMQTFALNACNKKIENGCLDYHLGSCPGTCKSNFDLSDYTFRLALAMDVLRNKHDDFIARIKEKISKHNAALEFEKSKRLNEYIADIETIFNTIHIRYSAAKFTTDIFVATAPTTHIEVNTAVGAQLAELLGFVAPIRTIDCFDISHFQSRNIVGSCIRFTDGKPDKAKFRRFAVKSLTEQNDYAALQEIVMRRYKDGDDLPDLMLIDGGKGQLSAILAVFPNAQLASLAKREERLYSSHHPEGIPLNVATDIGKLLISLRDYAHHFAISFHRLKRSKETSASL